MDPEYENLLEVGQLAWTMLAYAVHGAIAGLHVGLASFLCVTSLTAMLRPNADGPWLRCLGFLVPAAGTQRRSALVRGALGLLLLAPVLVAAPMSVSLAAAVASFVWLAFGERSARPFGGLARTVAGAAAVLTAAFMVWEGDDNLRLTAQLVGPAMEWRAEEVDWQLQRDPASPKRGDLAPDFELQDPEGRRVVRLSDFRGKRPVALIFGSYT